MDWSRTAAERKRRTQIGVTALCLVGLVAGLRGQELFIGRADVGSTALDRMYVKGLQYLVRTQSTEGNWPDKPYGGEPAVVALAVLSMLAHGDDPNDGPYSQAIHRGFDYILKAADPQTGYIGHSMYNHGFSTLALAEGYGAVDDPRIGPALERAVRLILDAQAHNPQGAWRYSPESTDADTTVTGAEMVALFAARNAGIGVPEAAIQKGLRFYERCQTASGGFGYMPGTAPNGARTAIGCLVFALAQEKEAKAFAPAFNFLRHGPPQTTFEQYYLYYAAQAIFQGSPDTWRGWNLKNIQTLEATQVADGEWDGQFGPTFGTAASLLSLALNYRFLPIYER